MSAGGISRQDVRDDNERRVRELALELDHIGDFDPYMYVPPGPVAQAFLNSTSLTAVLMGPLGGGKTTTCVFKRMMEATLQPIAWHPEDGKPTRMSRGIILRDTFRAVEKTVLESWKQWFPKSYPGTFLYQGGNDRPLTHGMRFMGGDGIRVEALTEFAGLGEQSIESMMKGREYDFGWLNELDTHIEGALDDIEQRLGRYPSADSILTPREIAALEAKMGLPPGTLYQPEERMKMAIGDMNAPTVDNWTYETLVTSRGPDRAFFQQPSGRSPDAENKLNLDKGYYERIVANQDERFVERMVDNKFGYSRSGKAVHPSFDHIRHVASSEILVEPNLDLHIGVDVSTGGLSPAAMLGQATGARIRFIDELYEGHGVGPARFGEALQRLMNDRYGNFPRSRVKLWADPASQGGADTEHGQLDALQILSTALGVPGRIPGDGSNAIGMRTAVVDAELRGWLEANSALLISPRCKLYIGGIAGKYRFKKKPESATNEYEDMPEKAHPWSDLQDAGQYAIIGIRGAAHVRKLLQGQLAAKAGRSDGEGRQHWSSQQGGENRGWKSQGGFDPHKAGAR